MAVFCVNIPVLSGGDSDPESTVHSLQSRFPPLRQHAQGQGRSAGVGSGPWGPSAQTHPKPWHWPQQPPPPVLAAPHSASGGHGCSALLRQVPEAVPLSSGRCLPGQRLLPALGPSDPGWKLGGWNRTGCSHLHQLKWQHRGYIKSFWLTCTRN